MALSECSTPVGVIGIETSGSRQKPRQDFVLNACWRYRN